MSYCTSSFFNRSPSQFPEMDYLVFLLAIFHVYKAHSQEVSWDSAVKLAEKMTLECVYPGTDTVTQVEWYKIKGKNKTAIAVFNPMYGLDMKKPYHDRVFFSNATLALNDLSLAFHNASSADVGTYWCYLHTFPSGSWKKEIQVVPSDYFETIESLKYSPMVVEPGNVTLTYKLQMEGPVQQVTWERIQPHQIDLLSSCNLSQGKSYQAKYHRQVLTHCSPGSKSSFIVIQNATASDSGLYRCRFKMSTGENETYVLELTVKEGKTSNQYAIFVPGGIALLLLVVLIIVIIIFCNRRRRRQRNDIFKNSWDTQNNAVKTYRSPVPTHQYVDDPREDVYVNYPTFPRRPKPKS